MIQNIVFDLGGVLIDWDPRYLYRDIFKAEEDMEYFLQFVCSMEWNALVDAGLPFEDAIRERTQYFPHFSREIQLYRDHWDKMIKGEITPVVNILRHFKAQKHFRLFALSNWSAETFPIAEKRFAFLNDFDGVILSGEEKVIKPDPEIYHRLLQRFQIQANQCLFIDDRLENVKSALDLDFLALHYRDPVTLKYQLQALGLIGPILEV